MSKEMRVHELIDFLMKYRGMIVKFNENPHFSDELVDVSTDDFEVKDGAIVLPNLCACYPEPD